MELFAGWPEVVVEHIRRAYGQPVSVQRLGGMSLARVYRATFTDRSLIVKASPREMESLFYERVAAQLRGAGIGIPHAEWVGHLPEGHWLILEDIPESLPVASAGEWHSDGRVLDVLARLHTTTRRSSFNLPESPARGWSEQVTSAAVGCFASDVADTLAPLLDRFRVDAGRLTGGWCWISGDPSPPNWGVRQDGTLALFDWELFRQGVPATDIAITVPGLGDREKFRRAAVRYLEAPDLADVSFPWELEVLVRDTAVAKVGTVVMLLGAHAEGNARVPEEHVARLVDAVPRWLRSLG